MINDVEVLDEIRTSWEGAKLLRDKYRGAILGSMATGGHFAIFAADAVQNLPFIHACSVLNEALLQLAKEERFKCKSFFLGKLVEASKDSLPWVNIDLVKELINKRNEITHKGSVIPRSECWKYMDAIEDELKAWKIVTDETAL